MANLSKTTIRKMRRVIAAVMANPKFYDQQQFPDKRDCGTTCCAAGFAVWLEGAREYKKLTQKNNIDWQKLAERALGLGDTHGDLFFGPYTWREDFGDAYITARTPLDRAKAMKAWWEYYISQDRMV